MSARPPASRNAYLKSRDGVRGAWSDRIDGLFEACDKQSRPGLNLAVIKGGAVVHARGYGVADIEHDVAFAPDTVLRLGSTSKHMCAACIYLLVQDKRLSVDDDVRTHIPELRGLGARITVDNLLTMTSGLPDWLNLSLFAGLRDTPPTRRADMLAWLERLDATMFPPGATSSYSNTNYALLSLIIERVSGQTLVGFMRERLFAPLAMHDTQLVPSALQTIPRMAKGYQPDPDGAPVAGLMLPEIHGEGAINSTIEDMTRWFLSYRAGGVAPGLRTWLEEGIPLSNGAVSPYRRAIVVDRRGDVVRVGHAGGMPGYLCDFAFYPELDVGIVMLTNWFDPSLFAQIDPIAEIVSARAFAAAPPAAGDAPPNGLFADAESGRALSIDRANSICHCLGEVVALQGEGRGRWRFAKRGDFRALELSDEGQLTLRDGALAPAALKKCEAPLPVGDPSRYVGTYWCPTLGEHHLISWDGTHLAVSTGSVSRPLLWSRLVRRCDELFTAPIDGEPSETNVTLTFRRGDDGAIAGFDYAISRVYGLRFDRVRGDA